MSPFLSRGKVLLRNRISLDSRLIPSKQISIIDSYEHRHAIARTPNCELYEMFTLSRLCKESFARKMASSEIFSHLSICRTLRFSVREIASLLGVGVRTVERRMHEFGLSARSSYSTITDAELDLAVESILRSFPNAGYKRMSGFLTSRGLRVQQNRIRSSMRRVDHKDVSCDRLR